MRMPRRHRMGHLMKDGVHAVFIGPRRKKVTRQADGARPVHGETSAPVLMIKHHAPVQLVCCQQRRQHLTRLRNAHYSCSAHTSSMRCDHITCTPPTEAPTTAPTRLTPTPCSQRMLPRPCSPENASPCASCAS